MSFNDEHFECTVQPGCYRWVEAASKRAWKPTLHGERLAEWEAREAAVGPTPVLVVVPSDPPSGRDFTYRPLVDVEYAGLFRAFAGTPATPGGIVGFADRYGTLGPVASVRLERPIPELKWHPPYGESFRVWCTEIERLREVVEAWDSLRSGSGRAFGSRIRQTPDSISVVAPNGREHIVADRLRDPSLFDELRDANPWKVGWFFLRQRVNLRFAIHHQLEIRLVWTGHAVPLTWSLVPSGLLDVVWWQFVLAVDGDRNYEQCDCGRWFELSLRANRRSRRYCSNACRSRGYRSREAQAQRFAQQGLSAEEIAARMQRDPKTIRRWLRGADQH
jgi:hypothetical protein